MSTCNGYRLLGCVPAEASNRLFDVDVLSVGFTRLLATGQLRR